MKKKTSHKFGEIQKRINGFPKTFSGLDLSGQWTRPWDFLTPNPVSQESNSEKGFCKVPFYDKIPKRFIGP